MTPPAVALSRERGQVTLMRENTAADEAVARRRPISRTHTGPAQRSGAHRTVCAYYKRSFQAKVDYLRSLRR